MANENYAFTKQEKKSLKKLLDFSPRHELVDGAESFLLCYIGFEAVCRKVWNYHRSAKANKRVNETHSALPLPAIKKAFKAYGIRVSDIVLEDLLNSEKKKRGEKSARNLRNGLVHRWNNEDRKEVIDRETELVGKLSLVIDAIKQAYK